MLLIFNKQKIWTYFVLIMNVVMLFSIAKTFNQNQEERIAIKSNINSKVLPVYSVKTDENKNRIKSK